MTAISNNNIAKAIYEGSRDKQGHELSPYVKDVVKFLARKRLVSKASDILSKLEKIINQSEDRVVARVSGAEALDHKTKLHISYFLKDRYSAKDIVLEEILDKKLLGGIKIEVNDEIIDLSIQNRMRKLQEHLIR